MADHLFLERLRNLREAVHSDLKPEIRIDLAGNGWPFVEEAIRVKNEIGSSELGDWFEEAFQALNEGNERPAEALLTKYWPATELLDKALDAPFWHFGVDRESDWTSFDMPQSMFDSRHLVQFQWLRASLTLSKGNPNDAARSFCKAGKIGQLLCESHHSYMAFLIGIAWHTGTRHRLIGALSHPAWTDDALVRLTNLLAPWDIYQHLRLCFTGDLDYYFIRYLASIDFPHLPYMDKGGDYSELLASLTDGHPNAFDAADTVRYASALMVQMIESWQNRTEEIDLESEFEKVYKAWPARVSNSFGRKNWRKPLAAKTIEKHKRLIAELDNPYGRLLVFEMMAVSSSANDLAIKHIAVTNALELAIAIIRYRLKFDCLPIDLDAVIKSGLLDLIPTDPYCDGPIEYDPTISQIRCHGPHWQNLTWQIGQEDGKDGLRN